MSSEVLISVPAEVAAQIFAHANDTGRSVGETLKSALQREKELPTTTMEDWPDEAVLKAADSRMPAGPSDRQGELLELRKHRDLTPEEQTELTDLFEMSTAGNLHKARGMLEAFRRGLRQAPVGSP